MVEQELEVLPPRTMRLSTSPVAGRPRWKPKSELSEKLIDVLALTGVDFFNAAVDFLKTMTGVQSFIYLQCPERKFKLVVKGSSQYWSEPRPKTILRRFVRDVFPAASPAADAVRSFHHHEEGIHYRIIPFEVSAESCCVLTLVATDPITLPAKFYYVHKTLGQRIVDEANRLFAQEKIRKIAYYDHLTGLANRRVLDKHIEILTSFSRRVGNKIALLFIDLDNFKEINDRYGHQVGDVVLVEFARLLQERCRRKSDLVVRYGGDEFVVVLSGVDKPEEALSFAAELQTKMESFCLRSDIRVTLSASIGISIFPDLAETTEDLIATADKAVYEAKNSGKSRCVVYKSEEVAL